MSTNLEKVAVLATLACVIKMLVENVSFTVFGHPVNLGHTDAMVYTAMLAPLWGSHAFMNKGNSDATKN
jgi:hypothetical protein